LIAPNLPKRIGGFSPVHFFVGACTRSLKKTKQLVAGAFPFFPDLKILAR
jgi:hypothetical protein